MKRRERLRPAGLAEKRRLFERLGGQPRAFEFLNASLQDRAEGTPPESLLPETEEKVHADQLLQLLWEGRSAEEQDVLRALALFLPPPTGRAFTKL